MRFNLTPQLLVLLESIQRMKHAQVIAGVQIGPGKLTIHSLHARLAKNRAGPRKPIIVPENQRRGFVPLRGFGAIAALEQSDDISLSAPRTAARTAPWRPGGMAPGHRRCRSDLCPCRMRDRAAVRSIFGE